jgi:hypothetical protein
MKTRISFFVAATVFIPVLLAAQTSHINDRVRYAVRAGLAIGTNLSMYSGDVPLRPMADNTHYATGGGSNITIAGLVEKPFSQSLTVGATLAFEPMGGSVTGTFKEPFRVSDEVGNLYEVVRNYRVDYNLYYLTLGGYAKLYPVKNSGAYASAGLRLSTLMKDLYYSNTATVKEPQIYEGAVYKENQSISDSKRIRASLDLGVGYEIRTTYVLISPEVHYDIGFSKVIDTAWSDSWRINNVRLIVSATFPIVTL